MPKMTFVCEHQHPINKESNLSKMTYESNREYLYDILEDFEDFLRGCGFYIDGKLEIVNNDDDDVTINLDCMDTSYTPQTDTIIIQTDHNDYYYDTDRNR